MNRTPIMLVLAVLLPGAVCPAQQLQRPYMIWDRADIERISAKLKNEPWAAQRLEKLRREAPKPEDRAILENYFLHLMTGDGEAQKFEKQVMLHFAEVIASPKYAAGRSVEIGPSFSISNYDLGFRFDLFGEAVDPEWRRVCETKLNRWSTAQMKNEYLRGLEHRQAMCSAILALATGDKRVIQAAFDARCGVRAYFDGMVDGYFSPLGANPDMTMLGALWLWCRGVERLGLNELGFGYTGKTGGTLHRLLEGYLLVGDPKIDIPGGAPFYGRSAMTLAHRLRQLDFFDLQSDYGVAGYGPHGGGGGSRIAFALPKMHHPRDIFRAPIVIGRLRDGAGEWPPLLPLRNEMFYSYDKRPRDLVGMPQIEYNPGVDPISLGIHWPLVLELAHQRWPDAGFGYFLCRLREPENGVCYPSLFWGLDPLPVVQAKAPAARSMVLPTLGMAVLRAEEGPAFWDSPAPYAVLRLTDATGGDDASRRLGLNDPSMIAGSALSLHSFHAFNRPIYRWVKPPKGVPLHAATGKTHNTVVLDNQDRAGVGVGSVRQHFAAPVKFTAVRSVPPQVATTQPLSVAEGPVAAGVEMERALAMTGQYLLDVFRVAADRDRTCDWMIHALGSAVPDRPEEWKPTELLNASLGTVHEHKVGRHDQLFSYKMAYHFGEQHALENSDGNWSLCAVQTACEAEPDKTVMGPEWYGRNVGVRITMLGESGTKVVFAREVLPRSLTAAEEAQMQEIRFPRRLKPRDGKYDQQDSAPTEIPISPPAGDVKDKSPASAPEFRPVGQAVGRPGETGGVAIIAQRRAARTLFVALHEPFEKMAWNIDQFRCIQQTDDAVAVAIRGKASSPVDDRVMVRMGGLAPQPITLAGGGESFTFKSFAYVRASDAQVIVAGDLSAMRLKVKGSPKVLVNGQERTSEVRDGWLTLGK